METVIQPSSTPRLRRISHDTSAHAVSSSSQLLCSSLHEYAVCWHYFLCAYLLLVTSASVLCTTISQCARLCWFLQPVC